MVAIRGRARDWWLAKPDAERTHLFVLLLAVVGYLLHYIIVFCWIQPFYIEDSAISFSYARNLVEGLGLVPYPGGERVEGYSNALWTFLIAGFYAIGVPVWTSSKLMGGMFGAIAMLFSYGLARRALPPDEKYAKYALLAPWLLAASTQFVLWNSSGLENSLFCLTLSGGMYWLAREAEENRRFPWSALFFCALTMTRPDGLAYAAIAVFTRVATGVWRRQWLAILAWAVVFAVPYGIYGWWRYEYFAWPFPNTYYAKDKDWKPFVWTQLGWKQIREYNFNYGIVWAVPAMVWAVMGLGRKRAAAVLVGCALLAGALLWDGKAGIPLAWRNDGTEWLSRHWVEVRVYYITGWAVIIGLGAFGRKGWETRGMLWASYAAGMFFCVFSSGDWMKAYRWFSLTSVPQFTMLAVGFGLIAEALPWRERVLVRVPVRALYALVPTIALMAANIPRINEFVLKPETAPRDVHRRAEFMRWVQGRLELPRVTLMDVDMGAHMWYTDWEIVDMAGLIDMPIGHRKYQKSFMSEYVFQERRPEFAHVHGSWANTTKIPRIDRWKDEYVEIPGYASGKRALHIGNHIRRDIIAKDRWDGPADRQVRFAGGVRMEGWDLPSAAVASGGELQIDTMWRVKERKDGFRVLAFLANEQGYVWSGEVAPGYDWIPVEEWGPLDFVTGRWSVKLPDKLAEGTYDLGFVLLDPVSGQVLPFQGVGPGDMGMIGDPLEPVAEAPLDPVAPVFMAGEWRIPGAVEIVSATEAQARAKTKADEAIAAAKAGDCDGAETLWRNARHHVWKNDGWIKKVGADVDAARVSCLLAHAEDEKDDYAKSRWLRKARWIDPKSPALLVAGPLVGERLEAKGDVAMAAESWDDAYFAYSAAVTADPTRSWARRHAEECRDKRLGIVDPKGPDKTASPAKATPKKTPAKTPAKAPMKPTAPPTTSAP